MLLNYLIYCSNSRSYACSSATSSTTESPLLTQKSASTPISVHSGRSSIILSLISTGIESTILQTYSSLHARNTRHTTTSPNAIFKYRTIILSFSGHTIPMHASPASPDYLHSDLRKILRQHQTPGALNCTGTICSKDAATRNRNGQKPFHIPVRTNSSTYSRKSWLHHSFPSSLRLMYV